MFIQCTKWIAILAMAGFTSLASAVPILETTTLNFSGDCWDCTAGYNGSEPANPDRVTAQLVLDTGASGYQWGTELVLSDIVSLTYNGSSLVDAFTIDPVNPSTMGVAVGGNFNADGSMNTDGSISPDGLVDGTFFLVWLDLGGALDICDACVFAVAPFEVDGVNWLMGDAAVPADFGGNGSFTVPAPGTLALMAIALLSFSASRRRAR